MKSSRQFLFSVMALAGALAASASPSDDIKLGRIFMTTEERERLDHLRRVPKPQHSNVSSVKDNNNDVPVEQSSTASGYIISSNGAPYKWVDGDFRRVRPTQIEAENPTPNIRIVSHHSSSTASQEDVETGDEESDDQRPEHSTGSGDNHGSPH